jgi:hypothetical protein
VKTVDTGAEPYLDGGILQGLGVGVEVEGLRLPARVLILRRLPSLRLLP